MEMSKVGLRIGICGLGQFSSSFIPLYQAHPGVDEVVVADVVPERVKQRMAQFGVERGYAGLDELLEADIDAVVLLTQRHLHGPQSIKVLESGKHLYCAVPIGQSIEEIKRIVELAEKRRLIYMTGETSYYYPATIYCRERHRRGDFGDIFYGEAQYFHDMSHGFYDAFKYSGGEEWRKVAGIPPMHYPTHSVSMILSVTGSYVTEVSCMGWEDNVDDGVFKRGANLWNNVFSNETALMRTADGGMCRINEFRRVGWSRGNSVHLSLYGTHGCYEEQAGAQCWTGLKSSDWQDLSELLSCEPASRGTRPDNLKTEADKGLHAALKSDFFSGVSKVHPVERLPESFKGLRNGHYGSHQFLVDDFVKAVLTNKLPPNHVWAAARYCIPGIVAHQSAEAGGALLKVPDLGEPPADWELLDVEAPVAV